MPKRRYSANKTPGASKSKSLSAAGMSAKTLDVGGVTAAIVNAVRGMGAARADTGLVLFPAGIDLIEFEAALGEAGGLASVKLRLAGPASRPAARELALLELASAFVQLPQASG